MFNSLGASSRYQPLLEIDSHQTIDPHAVISLGIQFFQYSYWLSMLQVMSMSNQYVLRVASYYYSEEIKYTTTMISSKNWPI